MNKRLLTLLLVSACILAACGSRQVRNQPPLAQITSWTVAGEELRVELHLRNVNEEPLPLFGVQLSLRLGEVQLASHWQTLDESVAASGFESIPLSMTATGEGLREFQALQEGAKRSLPYTLEGYVLTSSDRELRFLREGHIYTVPGRPGQFR